MRDIVLLALLPFLLFAAAKRPFIALGLWIWTAMFFPNAWVYGAASGIRYNLLFSGVAILGYFLSRDKQALRPGSVGTWVLLFLAWTTISTIFTIGEPVIAWDIWTRFFKVILLFIFVLLIINKKLHIDFFLWCLVLSIGFYAGLESLKFIVSGGGHKIAGFAGHALGDRNELAIAFVMMLPICFYLLGEYGKEFPIIKFGLIGLIAFLVIAVIGTQSRGGFIALLALGGYLYLKSKRKLLLTALIILVVAVLAGLVSEEWFSRMNTIENADQDASFMGRVVAWKLSFILAVNHPIFGGGFKALENIFVWSQLAQDFYSLPFFYSGDALPDPQRPKAAHSIYFQVMGDHGFVGLGIYLVTLFLAFKVASGVAKQAKSAAAPAWIGDLATMLQLSIFAFCVGGAALSFAYFEVTFALFGLIVILDKKILAEYLLLHRNTIQRPITSTVPTTATGRHGCERHGYGDTLLSENRNAH